MKTYLGIGAGPGIGLSTAARFAREGFRIVLASRTGERLAGAVAALRASGADVALEKVDASDSQSVADLVRRHGPDLAVMHYNAGILHYDAAGRQQPRTLAQETVEGMLSETRINLVSALVAIQAAQEAMAPRRAGTILLTGGGFAFTPSPDFITLSVAKAGLQAAAKALLAPARALGIHVATVTIGIEIDPDSEQARAVGDAFWNLHAQPEPAWTWETIVDSRRDSPPRAFNAPPPSAVPRDA